MEYMLLIYGDQEALGPLAQEARQAVLTEMGNYNRYLTERGKLRSAAPLAPAASATVVRIKDGEKLMTDGPYAETKEQMGGYFLVDCEDLDDAIEVAAGIPVVRLGASIEIRPIWEELIKASDHP